MKNNINRLTFLKKSALATAGSLLIPRFLKAMETNPALGLGQKILVVVQLSGGNDGLNTVIPFGDDRYYQNRPLIGIPQNEILKLNEMQGLHPALQPLKKLFDEEEMSIVNSVGYPEPNRSHFRSMDIWQSGSGSQQYLETGWIGRFLDQNPNIQARNAIEVSNQLSLALKGQKIKGLAISDPKHFYQTTATDRFKLISEAHQQGHHHAQADYLYQTLAESISSAEYIHEKHKVQSSKAEYPGQALGQSFKTVAQMINSGLDTRIYYLNLNGFDSHVNQKGQQQRLLDIYAKSVAAFADDMKMKGKWKDVVVVTFSEFGRRVKENASRGTDHGTANNLFLMGGSLKKAGIYNPAPDLGNLDNGDLKYQVDFRQIYAEILGTWLGSKPQNILGQAFKPLGIL